MQSKLKGTLGGVHPRQTVGQEEILVQGQNAAKIKTENLQACRKQGAPHVT
jgi:hypothetical protein